MDCTSRAVPQTSNSLSVQYTRATHALTIDYTAQLNQSSASNPRAVGIFLVVMAKCEIEKNLDLPSLIYKIPLFLSKQPFITFHLTFLLCQMVN